MNTNNLKRFAQEARRKLIEQVGARLELVLNTDSAELREKVASLVKLKDAINKTNKEQVIDKVAYTWFNRLMALRYMDANDYQPIGVRVLTPKYGDTLPELLYEAKQGNIPHDLPVKPQHIYDLLDGRIPSKNAQNEAYKELLIGACNHLNKVLPFLFEKINDYTELLLPDDLSSEFSIIQDIRDGMCSDDCSEVEIIGWLYQFYISELNEDLISSKKKYEKNELAPASQLFTPKWIVQYMVDNTLGQLWSEFNPNTKVTSKLEYYIKPAYKDKIKQRDLKSIEEIKFFEPSVGSGHILSYAFEVFYKIYEEEGYNPSEISELIITKNLFGADIDERAAQLASFVLLMKGTQKNKRFLRSVAKNKIQPNIIFYQDFELDNKFNNASVLGSLIKVEHNEANKIEVDSGSLFSKKQEELKKLYQLLGQRYDAVVTNPPYINSSRMELSLKQYVDANYPETKSDLFSTFVIRNLELCNENGLTGYMTPFVWMFISSYEKLREIIINKHFINNLIQLEYSGFDGATVPICTFTLRNQNIKDAKGSYIRLSDFKGAKVQAPKTIEAIQNPNCGWFYTAMQKDFNKIPGNSLGYWLGPNFMQIFQEKTIADYSISDGQTKSGNNDKYLRLIWETSKSNIGKSKKWVKHPKGGAFRKWYGNLDTLINWSNKAREHYRKDNVARILPEYLWWKNGISWTLITSSAQSFRDYEDDCIFNLAAPTLFFENELIRVYCIGLLNTPISEYLLKAFNPTLNCNIGEVQSIPLLENSKILDINKIIIDCIKLSKNEWNSRENSFDFLQNELIRINSHDIEETFDLYMKYWENKYFQLYKNEEEINRQFIEIYGLQDELSPDVPLEDITILKEETSIKKGKLVFNTKEVFAQFISYAVGCMFGRYSLDKEGLILANQGETLEDYFKIIERSHSNTTFLPDDDNIIPVLDDEWFDDDITARFYEFIKVTFGKENYEKNLTFIEEAIGKDIRKYFAKDFYADHIKRYKKRPIYWMFSSPKGSFNVLIYLHRYTPDTLNQILNNYLKEYREKLSVKMEHQDFLIVKGTSLEQTKASKEKDKLKLILFELQEYERDILYPLATERIHIDLDYGVLVNYNKFGKAIKEVNGLNDKKTKDKVREFDWIDVETIK